MISTKDATNVSPSYMTALATEKKNMYYTRMLLARCNNALMSGIIDSFLRQNTWGNWLRGRKNVRRCLKCVRKQNATRATTYVLLAPRDPLEIDDVIGFVRLSLLVHYYELTSFWMCLIFSWGNKQYLYVRTCLVGRIYGVGVTGRPPGDPRGFVHWYVLYGII